MLRGVGRVASAGEAGITLVSGRAWYNRGMKRPYLSARAKLGLALGVSSLASIGLFVIGAIANNSTEFWYLIWNLFLAWIGLLIALWLEQVLHRSAWSSWYAMFVTLLWAISIPNTFYLITDYIHIFDVTRVDHVFDVVMFSSFIFNGVILGYLSVYVIHRQLLKRLTARASSLLVGLVLLLCSFGIYIGRELRWNTWDVITNPWSVLFDVSDRILNPSQHPQVFSITFSFFVLLSTTYAIFWYAARAAGKQPEQ